MYTMARKTTVVSTRLTDAELAALVERVARPYERTMAELLGRIVREAIERDQQAQQEVGR
jgi:delta 1-pyrroline-5-carboxylate dehydrogenase